jgi:hypothetical protein
MKTLNQGEAKTLKAIVTDMGNVAKHQALLAIIRHLEDYHVLNQVRLREIIDDASKYDSIMKTNNN